MYVIGLWGLTAWNYIAQIEEHESSAANVWNQNDTHKKTSFTFADIIPFFEQLLILRIYTRLK